MFLLMFGQGFVSFECGFKIMKCSIADGTFSDSLQSRNPQTPRHLYLNNKLIILLSRSFDKNKCNRTPKIGDPEVTLNKKITLN